MYMQLRDYFALLLAARSPSSSAKDSKEYIPYVQVLHVGFYFNTQDSGERREASINALYQSNEEEGSIAAWTTIRYLDDQK